MIRKRILLWVLILFVLTIGCSNLNTNTANENNQSSDYYIVENTEKTYFENAEFMKNVYDFNLILENTIKSLNEIKDGKRDLNFIKQIESDELKQDEEYKIFSLSIPGNSELKTIKADINYKVTALQYNKDQNLIKVFVSSKTNEKNKIGFVTVFNHQTFIFKIENNKLLLIDYDLSQYLK